MNFLLRPTQSAAAAADQPPSPRPFTKSTSAVGAATTTLEGLIAEDNKSPLDYSSDQDSPDSFGGDNGHTASQNFTPLADKHVDVKDDEGWVAIPFSMFISFVVINHKSTQMFVLLF